MNQAHKSNFKTHVEKLNPTSRTDLSNKTLRSTLYWKLTFKPFPYKSFGWCNAHSVQADALWGRSFKFQMKNTPQNQYFPANAERMDVHCLESGCIGKYIYLFPNTSLLSAVYGYITKPCFLSAAPPRFSPILTTAATSSSSPQCRIFSISQRDFSDRFSVGLS